MKYPFVWLSLFFTLGVVLERFFQPAFVPILCLIFCLLPFLWGSRGTRFYFPLLIVAVVGMGIIFSTVNHRESNRAVDQWATERRVSLQGTIKSSPEIKRTGKKEMISFILKSKSLGFKSDDGYFLHDVDGDVMVFLFNPKTELSWGEEVRLFGILEKPKIALNPGQLDYAKHLARQSIESIFLGYGERSVKHLDASDIAFWKTWTEKSRKWAKRKIGEIFTGETALLLKALILGDRKEMSHDMSDMFMKTGTSQVLPSVTGK